MRLVALTICPSTFYFSDASINALAMRSVQVISAVRGSRFNYSICTTAKLAFESSNEGEQL
ncbi:hypothetical protein Pint_06328 [Pistacia integerrima]|uniref:Uncharacterized protein n=1 Tax=Pistacia integerrima TaxID=434235 RepID=A0ACC0ZA23_9ROSI|nr:hypothetical protein Pint_06328 [Pistacia integerrima]